MNKLKTIVVSGVVAAMSFVSVANSIEIRAGLTGNTAGYYGNATETLKDSGHKESTEAVAAFSYASGFAEVAFDSAMGITLGLEFTPDSISLDDADRLIKCAVYTGGGCVTGEDAENGVQKVSANVKDLTTAYIAVPLMSTGLYVKAGLFTANMETKETLATGSTYGNKDLEGTSIGMFYDGALGDMFFYRMEAAYMEFDDVTADGSEVGGTTGSYNKITAELGGVEASLSLGLRF
jgi:hypothetical protein